jgi:two-component system cell cycle response regulator DivK
VARRAGEATRAHGITGFAGESVKYLILVVEDNPMNRELLCDWLEAEGHEVLSAEDLSSARCLLQERQPDAVLLDVQLGNEDGLSLAAWMRKQPELCHLPVIAVTAHAMVTEHQRFLQAGCNACVSKPINFKLLGAELQQWLAPSERLPSTR